MATSSVVERSWAVSHMKEFQARNMITFVFLKHFQCQWGIWEATSKVYLRTSPSASKEVTVILSSKLGLDSKEVTSIYTQFPKKRHIPKTAVLIIVSTEPFKIFPYWRNSLNNTEDIAFITLSIYWVSVLLMNCVSAKSSRKKICTISYFQDSAIKHVLNQFTSRICNTEYNFPALGFSAETYVSRFQS